MKEKNRVEAKDPSHCCQPWSAPRHLANSFAEESKARGLGVAPKRRRKQEEAGGRGEGRKGRSPLAGDPYLTGAKLAGPSTHPSQGTPSTTAAPLEKGNKSPC